MVDADFPRPLRLVLDHLVRIDPHIMVHGTLDVHEIGWARCGKGGMFVRQTQILVAAYPTANDRYGTSAVNGRTLVPGSHRL